MMEAPEALQAKESLAKLEDPETEFPEAHAIKCFNSLLKGIPSELILEIMPVLCSFAGVELQE